MNDANRTAYVLEGDNMKMSETQSELTPVRRNLDKWHVLVWLAIVSAVSATLMAQSLNPQLRLMSGYLNQTTGTATVEVEFTDVEMGPFPLYTPYTLGGQPIGAGYYGEVRWRDVRRGTGTHVGASPTGTAGVVSWDDPETPEEVFAVTVNDGESLGVSVVAFAKYDPHAGGEDAHPEIDTSYPLFAFGYTELTLTGTYNESDCLVHVSSGPVEMGSGAKRERITDVSWRHGGTKWTFSRQYHSKSGMRSVLGYNWWSNWDRRLYMTDSDGDLIVDALEDAGEKEEPEDWSVSAPYGVDQDGDLIPAGQDPDDTNANVPQRSCHFLWRPAWGTSVTLRSARMSIPFPSDASAVPNDSESSQKMMEAMVYHHMGGTRWATYYVSDQDGSMTGPRVAGKGSYALMTVHNWGESDATIELRNSAGGRETYYGFHNPPKPEDGRLRSASSLNGQEIRLEYDWLGRVSRFYNEKDELLATLSYWDDVADAWSCHANLLRRIEDPTGRVVEYSYDHDGNLFSVNVCGRETRYEYYASFDSSLLPGFDSVLYEGDGRTWSHSGEHTGDLFRHNLFRIYRPREVAADPTNPKPYKQIIYGTNPEEASFNKVIAQTIGEWTDEGTTTTGGVQYFQYFLPSSPEFQDPTDGAAVSMTRHILEDQGTVVDYYHNLAGYVVAQKEHSGSFARSSEADFDPEGRIVWRRAIDGETGEASYLSFGETAAVNDEHKSLRRLFANKIASSNLEGCSGCGGSAAQGMTEHAYEPLTGMWRTKTLRGDDDGTQATYIWTRYFDYQELPLDTALLGVLAKRIFGDDLSGEELASARMAVAELIVDLGMTANDFDLGDLNGDGETSLDNILGKIVREDFPDVTAGQTSTQKRIRFHGYDSDGNEVFDIDEEGNKTVYEYDSDGNMTARTQDTSYTLFTSAETKSIAYTVDPTDRNNGATPGENDFVEARWTYTYDERGNRVSETNPRGVRTDYYYNIHAELTSTVQAAAIDTEYGQSPAEPSAGDASALEAFGFVTRNTYDANGQLIRVEREDPGRQRLCGRYVETMYLYDILGRRVAEGQEIGSDEWTSTTFCYDVAGRQVLKVYPEGNADFTEYDDTGRVVEKITGILNLEAALTQTQRDTIQNCPVLSSDLQGASLSTKYCYNDKGQVVYVEGPDGVKTHYEYDSMGRKVYEGRGYSETAGDTTDPLMKATHWVYDDLGRTICVTQTGKINLSAASPTSLTITRYVYDEAGRRIQTRQWVAVPEGVSTERDVSYPDDTWLVGTSVSDRLGRTVQTIQDDGASVIVEYDGAGRTIKTVQTGGNTTENTYDAAGNLIETRRTDVATTVTRSGAAIPDQVFVTTMFYDALGRLETLVDNVGNATDYRYDALGAVVATSDANGSSETARTFYRRGESADAVEANDIGNVTITRYDGAGRKTREDRVLTATGLGNGDQLGRDRVGTPNHVEPDVSQGGGDGIIRVEYEYSPNGWLETLIDDNGNMTWWQYDSHGRKVSETKGMHDSAASNPTEIDWSYRPDGAVLDMTKEDGTVVTYDYDPVGRLRSKAIARASAVRGTTQQVFFQDALGRRIFSFDNNSPDTASDDVAASWRYDSLGRVVEESQSVGGGTSRTVTTHYASTHRSAVIYPNERELVYAYHPNGAMRRVSDAGADSAIATYEYVGGRPLVRAMANGINLDLRNDLEQSGSGAVLFPRTAYDRAGRPAEWTHLDTNESDDPVKIGFSYAYDRVGNKRWQRVLHNPRDTQRYGYDSASRLVAYIRGDFNDADWCDAPTTQPLAGFVQSRRWDLDGLGNWMETKTKTDGVTATETREVDTFNAYTKIGETNQTHDLNGNLTGDGEHTYVWDGFNRLVAVLRADTGTTIALYRYDADNRRLVKDFYEGTTSDTLYCYTGWQVAEERAASDGALQRQFVYGNYIDEPLVMNVDGNADGDCLDFVDPVYTYHQNTLYSVYALTDVDGMVVEAWSYDPYGRHILHLDGADGDSEINFTSDDLCSAEGHSPRGNPYVFTARRHDVECRALQLRLRVCFPVLGGFASRDPRGPKPPEVGVYVYASTRPTYYADPFGLMSQFPSLAYSSDMLPLPPLTPPPGGPTPRPTPPPPPTSVPVPVPGPPPSGGHHEHTPACSRFARPGYTPQENGCGPALEAGQNDIVPDTYPPLTEPGGSFNLWDWTSACNRHDRCYGTCNSNRLGCDIKLALDMKDICDQWYSSLPSWKKAGPLGYWYTQQHQRCYGVATIFFLAIRAGGADPYMDAQEEACCFTCEHE